MAAYAVSTRGLETSHQAPRGPQPLDVGHRAYQPEASAALDSWWIGCDRAEFSRRLKEREAERMRLSRFGVATDAAYAPSRYQP